MRKLGGLLLAGLVVVAALIGAASAGAEVRPLDDGGMIFGPITSPASPEEYSYSVSLGEEQELRQIDDRHVGVYYSFGLRGITISAELAHAADGANVPTTLRITGEKVVTLTVHFLEGNAAAAGAPFVYPITDGAGWEGGFRSETAHANSPAEPTARSAQKVRVVRALGEDKLYYRPHFFLLSGDGTFGMNRVQWKSWGGATARATARAFVNDCIPYCAAGHIDRPRARLTLSRVVDCNGTPIYARLEYALTGPLPKGFPRQGGYSMRPLGADGKPEC